VIWAWVGFFAIVIVMLALDLGVFNKNDHAPSARESLLWTAAWITIGTAFTGVVYLLFEHGFMHLLDESGNVVENPESPGLSAATRYITAYLLEKSLSVDNIFVIALIFQRFKVEPKFRHRVLFWGVLGAVVMRAAMLFGGLWLLHRFEWLFYVFGAYLAYTGFKLLIPEKEAVEEVVEGEGNKRIRRWLRVAPKDVAHGGHFFQHIDGKRMLTTLGLALLTIEWTDLVFALDSIPAVLAVAPEPFIVYTSNIFAILGLRSLYFVLDSAVSKFHELRYALATILVFVGGKMIAHEWFHVPNWISLLLIISALTLAITVSLARARARRDEDEDDEDEDDAPVAD
jgi:tellurite resistance protein TerC